LVLHGKMLLADGAAAFRHWRDRATKPIENDLQIQDLTVRT
jgi:hypothetical protein